MMPIPPKPKPQNSLSMIGCLGGLALTVVSILSGLAGFREAFFCTVPTVGLIFLSIWWGSKHERTHYQALDAWRRSIAPPSGDSWRYQFEAEGLGDLIAETAPRVRLGLRLEKKPFDGKLGSSRLGGLPDLPLNAQWPGQFLTQINLAEVAQEFPDSLLPKSGYLWFFFDRGVDGRVYYAPAETPLSPAESPRSARGIRFVLFEDIPDNSEAPDAYSDIRDYLGEHKMFGYGNWVQVESEAGASKQLLLQLDCDDEVGFIWGDGQIYFLIDEEDLKRGRFERTTFEIQCT